MSIVAAALPLIALREAFGDRLLENESLERYTSARVGGPAEALVAVNSARELAQAVAISWENLFPYLILGGGSNVLVSDHGFHGLVILNRARRVRFEIDNNPPQVWAESGANFGALARQACSRGLGGLEWAVGIPGTVGGAVVGNAGAQGGDMAGCLILAEILHRNRMRGGVPDVLELVEHWTVEQIRYDYRSSLLKRQPGQAVVLSARLKLEQSTPEATRALAETYTAYRHRTQPPGATMGSMFKNPPGDFAGRLIEAAGLKGTRIGDAEISAHHANFFVNLGRATADDIYELIDLARRRVSEVFGITLELEIELVGEWQV